MSLLAIRALRGDARAQALRQDAVATTAQLVTWGFGNDTIERRASSGEWQRLFQGVTVLQSGPLTWRQRARGALLYAGRGAALSHRSAAYLREVDAGCVLYGGDDLGDLAAYAAVHELRQQGLPGLLVASAGGADSPKELTSQADLVVPGPAGVVALLDAIADAITPPAR